MTTLCSLIMLTGAVTTTRAVPVAKVKVSLPELPSAHEIDPIAFDNQDCVIVSDGKLCPGPPPPGVKKGPDPAKQYRSLEGFTGTHYADEVDGSGVAVLDESVTISRTGNWEAWGLVRNQLPHGVSDLTVTATLTGGDGAVLATVTVPVLTAQLRSGEPGPFHMTSNIPADAVARYEWTVSSHPSSTAKLRHFKPYKTQELPWDYEEASGSYLFWASFQNVGGPVQLGPETTLVVAWLDQDRRVVWTATALVMDGTTRKLGKGEAGTFEPISVVNPVVGPHLHRLAKILWVVAP